MAPMKTCTVHLPVLTILFVAFFCSTREARGQETITAPQECSGTFKVHSTQVTLLVQQRVTSEDDVVNCQYVFEASESAGLLVFANGITAIDDGEIPGCPVTIYDGDNQQVSSLCGHYDTAVIPVSSSRVTVAYRPEYQGSPYTVTLDLQVTRSDDDTSVLCADAELFAVPSVPVKYGVVLRDDGSASDDEQVCDYKVVSNAVNETLKTGCLLTSGGDCKYEVLLIRLCDTEDIITAPQQCSGTFHVHSTQVTLFIQQNVTSQDDVIDCQFTFVAPEDSGLLFFINDITAIDDGEIPGCPVEIYGNVAEPPVTSLCGHYPTLVVPVTSSKAVVFYRPVYQGSPYTLTVDLQVTTSDDVPTQLCADAELYAVPSVPLKYDIVFRDDGGSHDAEEFCEIKVFSSDADESLKTRCLLTSDGVCRYEVRLNNGSVLAEADQVVGIADAGGEVTVRLYPSGLAGVLGLTLPAEFEPVDKLERPPSVPTESSATVTGSAADVDFNVTDSIVTDDTTTVARLCNTEDTITAPQQCSGTFHVHSTQVTLFIQQNVTSQDDVIDCQFTFVAPGDSGLLFFVNDITAIDDGDIPGCPVEIYGNELDPPLMSLCGHYPTLVVPVTSSKAVVLYRPVYQGSPYTLTVDLQVTTSDDVPTQLCADAELYAVPSVPLKYDIVFRDDGASSSAARVAVFSSMVYLT
ncbi:hypothetical protein IscW_ISCW021690 [Ixodes scapularis]|uniref:Uncharacterized protein n=1 Tax=Ixodes scapularis TaxID=6945 RepID=B7Q3Z1_IXOSC|nr:hypothetical protein IscW_ISCW021690 [Ixodes scapularis]|eukprot:XP_002411420.1 hypothetical protein IscW_ISCW021690 [Ixodes scapularis]